MVKRIAATAFIFFCTAVAWVVLGGTIFERTYSSDQKLRGKVESNWGAPQVQSSPVASYEETAWKTVEFVEDGRKRTRTEEQLVTRPLPLESSRVEADFDLAHRQKGLLWYSTYAVRFGGEYAFRNSTAAEQDVRFTLAFPAEQAIYDDLVFTVDGEPVELTHEAKSVYAQVRIPAGQLTQLRVGYRSQGLDTWSYRFGQDVAQVRDFHLLLRTNFKDVDFPENTLSPTEKRETADGWELAWNYNNLLSGYQIGLAMPQKLQPGPLAGRISLFAPVSLLFFFFLLFLITTLRNIELHPMNYFFLAAAFFAFHLLLAYLVDHISIHMAFVVSSLVSIFLVVSYLRLVVGMRFAAVEAGLTQFIYLVLFSYAFFFEGFTGLTITIGSILTLFVVMQLTGRVRWAEKFARATPAPQAPSL